MTYAIAIVKKQKNLVNRTVSFENELVPLNGCILDDTIKAKIWYVWNNYSHHNSMITYKIHVRMQTWNNKLGH